MAKAVIKNVSNGKLNKLSESYNKSEILDIARNAEIIEFANNVEFIKTVGYETRVSDNLGNASFSFTMPFRVKFINIGIPGYSPTNVPPIGIAIIGVNNYIL